MNKIIVAFILFCYFCAISGQSSRPQSDCEKARAKAQTSRSVVNLVPNCEVNGDYSALQCHSNSTWCQCWRSNGTPVTQPSRHIKKCECLIHKANVTASGGPANANGVLVGAFVPRCDRNGGYHKTQCHGSTGFCWCSTDVGVQIGEQIRGTINCQ